MEKKYTQKFRKEWINNPMLKEWISECKDPEKAYYNAGNPNDNNNDRNNTFCSTNNNNDSDNSGNIIRNVETEVCATSVKLPSFWNEHPEAWFIHVETMFRNKRIQNDNSKYEHIIISLPQEVIMSVIDIVQNPPLENRYLTLKSKLLERHSLSEQRKLDKLLSDSVIGDRKPLEFYRYLLQLAGRNINSEFLKNVWLRKLPKALNIVLVGSNVVNTEDLLKIGDNIWEVSSKTEIYNVEPNHNIPRHSNIDTVVENLVMVTSAMCEQFNKLSLEISEVKNSFQTFRPTFSNRSRTML
ncbi:uncharacterized protein LOC124418963 [Lucilia cuprina]|uniref:uncharacterized protein LOC124418963 n=1 Tax=Lucilia cuprina TaxID=7375 RepID=UPI001F062821|nr:uncharacterized protein LOC124418963 [Lucilia cuprina]